MSINTLNTLRQFSQVTGVPSSGASRSSDFQPPTRNPQQAPGSLQQGGEINGFGSSQDILTDNPNARIIVPVNPAAQEPRTLGETSEGGWGLWYVLLGALIVAAVAYAWWQSYKNKRDYGMRVSKLTKEEVVAEVEGKEPAPAKKKTAPKKKPATTTSTVKPKSKPTGKKKSRRKRRNS